MKYSEELLWILDKIGARANTLESQAAVYKENISFVHSLGLKCDRVGWSRLDLSSVRAEEIFDKISSFCRENGWESRCLYTRKYVDFTSDWYELVPSFFKDNTPMRMVETLTEQSEKISTWTIRAFHELQPLPKRWGMNLFVPERFYNFCAQNNCDDLVFCWAKDQGKYKAEQYFHVYGTKQIPEIAVGFHLDQANTNGILAAGGWLPKISQTFDKIQQINLPDCYLRKSMPSGGIAYAYIPQTFNCVGRHTLLIHADVVQALLQKKIISPNAVRPVPVVDELPGGYSSKKTEPVPRPTKDFMDKMFAEFEKLKKADRPVRLASEKEGLKLLRSTKKERSEDFQKALSKVKVDEITDAAYRPLIPYYLIANGGHLSNEYEFLSYAQAIAETNEFLRDLESEELLTNKPNGVVIATCANGDVILLTPNGEILRFSHETPAVIEHWPSLAQFIIDTVNE